MPDIVAAMEDLAERIRAATDRPVTTDPRNASVTPCVIVEIPTLDYDHVGLCGSVRSEFPVIVVGVGTSRAELAPLAKLLDEVLAADISVIRAQPVAYEPLNSAGTADPCLAYRITVEEMI